MEGWLESSKGCLKHKKVEKHCSTHDVALHPIVMLKVEHCLLVVASLFC